MSYYSGEGVLYCNTLNVWTREQHTLTQAAASEVDLIRLQNELRRILKNTFSQLIFTVTLSAFVANELLDFLLYKQVVGKYILKVQYRL